MLINANAKRIPLANDSVNCCVTSPPYFGLRDYGTGKWEGGNAQCDHKTGRFERAGLSSKQSSNHGSNGDEAKMVCPKCGARRIDLQIGLENTPEEYVNNFVDIFREVRRVLRDDGTLWLNLGDSYANDGKWGGHTGGKHVKALHDSPIGRNKRYTGLKPKDLIGIPWRVAFALQADGWWLRQDIIWSKPNPMPESVSDRCTKAHEYIFLLSKSARYYYKQDAIKEPSIYPDDNRKARQNLDDYKTQMSDKGQIRAVINPAGARSYPDRNRRSVWTVATNPYPGAHFATFPPDLIRPCILAGCPAGGIVLDPFCGSGTTGEVARECGVEFIGLDINFEYLEQQAMWRAERKHSIDKLIEMPLFAGE
jgi:DNA modification methylase